MSEHAKTTSLPTHTETEHRPGHDAHTPTPVIHIYFRQPEA